MTSLPRRDILRSGVGLLTLGAASAVAALSGCGSAPLATGTATPTAPGTGPTTASSPANGASSAPTSFDPSSTPSAVRSSSSVAGGVRYDAGTLRTSYWPGHTVGWRVTQPTSGATGLVIALHGMDGSAADWVFNENVGAHALTTGLAIASIDGADRYWHARKDGTDTGTMVLETFLPMLAERGLPTGRVGLMGLSMGGYGSFLLASRLGADRVFGIATMSAALWTTLGDALPQAFDGMADFRKNDVFTRTVPLQTIPTWMSCGLQDPFIGGNRTFASRLPAATTLFDQGIHDGTYWVSHTGPALRFLADHV